MNALAKSGMVGEMFGLIIGTSLERSYVQIKHFQTHYQKYVKCVNVNLQVTNEKS